MAEMITERPEEAPEPFDLDDAQADSHRVVMLSRTIDFILLAMDEKRKSGVAKETETMEILDFLLDELSLHNGKNVHRVENVVPRCRKNSTEASNG
jgi:hypothetical protein